MVVRVRSAACAPAANRGPDGLDRLGCCRLRRRTELQRAISAGLGRELNGLWAFRIGCLHSRCRFGYRSRLQSPAGIIEHQVGNDLAAFYIEPAEVSQTGKTVTLKHDRPCSRIVETDHGGQEQALIVTQCGQRLASDNKVGNKFFLASGVAQPLMCAIAKPFGACDVHTAFSREKERFGGTSEMLLFASKLIGNLKRQKWVHGKALLDCKSGMRTLGPAHHVQEHSAQRLHSGNTRMIREKSGLHCRACRCNNQQRYA